MTALEDVELHLVDSFAEAERFMRWLGERRDVLAIDTETGGLEWWREPLRLVTIGDARDGWAIGWEDWAGLVKDAIQRYDDGPLVMHNMKFDTHFLEVNGVQVPRGRLEDTMLMAHLLDSTQSVALKSLSARLIDPRAGGNQQVLKEAMRQQGWTWATIPVDFETYWLYGALDAVLTARLYEQMKPQVDASFRGIYELELASTMVLTNMERRGLRIDREYVQRQLIAAEAWVEQTCAWVHQTYGVENVNSNPQLIRALQADGAPLTQRTEKGNLKLDEDVLHSLEHPLANAVVQIRKVAKVANSYFKNFLEMADGDVLHPSVHPVGARTGRMTVTGPALQTLPRGPVVRDAFIPRDGSRLVLADFDQVEMRVFAHFAREQGMIEAIRSGVDLHTYVCRELYQIPADQTPPREKRQITKNANFAKVYVAGVATFARTAGIPENDARAFLATYDGRFPGVRQFHAQVQQLAQERAASEGHAYVTTPFGRRHHADADKAYKLVNALIQGTCADLLKAKLVELDAAGFGDAMLLPIHDEVIFDIAAEDALEARGQIEHVMGERVRFAVPLSVHAEVVERWGDAYRDA